jgi:uncharacterized MAPEG superfamily protein
MTVAFWCVLAAALLPFLGTVAAKGGGRMPIRNNRNPREWLDQLEGWPKRAHWFQQNSFEAFPAFAAAVIIAQLAHGPQGKIDVLAMAFIGFRLLHLLFYLADIATARSVVWFGGIICVVWLFLLGA